ncbi:MAG TPA: TMEM175 family protein [Ktedonobacteraceae bacterium]|nr:TMEM175 family protein [Ktedonobacteraceae bacterium]
MNSFIDDKEHRTSEELTRTVALSDGIFAVAITLLVLDISVPEIEGLSGNALNGPLLTHLHDSIRGIICYVISFLVIGAYWRAHHQIFQYIRRNDAVLTYLNLLLLLLVAFLPVPTGYIGSYGSSPVAVAFYAPVVILTGLLLWAIWVYATTNHRLVDRDLNPDLIRYYTITFLLSPVVFLLSIPVIYINVFAPIVSGPDLAKYFWILALPAHTICRRIYGRYVNSRNNDEVA